MAYFSKLPNYLNVLISEHERQFHVILVDENPKIELLADMGLQEYILGSHHLEQDEYFLLHQGTGSHVVLALAVEYFVGDQHVVQIMLGPHIHFVDGIVEDSHLPYSFSDVGVFVGVGDFGWVAGQISIESAGVGLAALGKVPGQQQLRHHLRNTRDFDKPACLMLDFVFLL